LVRRAVPPVYRFPSLPMNLVHQHATAPGLSLSRIAPAVRFGWSLSLAWISVCWGGFLAAGEDSSRPVAAPAPDKPAAAQTAKPQASVTAEEQRVPLHVPPGFVATRYAGDDLAHNIFSLTTDREGHVVVSGPGYIKRLLDTDGDGVADTAQVLSTYPGSGAHSLLFVDDALICNGDNSLARLTDPDGDGVYNRREKLTSLRHPEHGANGLVQGPDGFIYQVCGNDAGLGPQHVTSPYSPIKVPKCGGVLRLSRDGRQMEVIAHGFRNPYDLDFSPQGHLLIVDSDGERDHHLPWYTPTRLFDVATGMEHGWLESGWQRSWNRPASFYDNVPRLVEFGRGSPTGAKVYRHRQFPPKYRGGLFCCCWTLGRVYYCPLAPQGASLQTTAEVFLQTAGDIGFAPVDLDVGPDGDLFVAIGGRGTAGGVFRIRYVGDAANRHSQPTDNGPVAAPSPVDEVLLADQPLAAWSRARWEPLARQLGPEAFVAAMLEHPSEAVRCRAVEVLVDVFGRLPVEAAQAALQRGVPATVQARIAWALGLDDPSDEAAELLARLTANDDALVERAAWESVARWGTQVCGMRDPSDCLARFAWQQGLNSRNRYVRSACALAADRMGITPPETTLAERSMALRLWLEREEANPADAFFAQAIQVWDEATAQGDELIQLEVLRAMQKALGDMRIDQGMAEVYAGYHAAALKRLSHKARRQAGRYLAQSFPTASAEVNRELARLLGMLQANSGSLRRAIAAQWTADSEPTDDIHYLIVLSRLPGKRGKAVTQATAEALVSLHLKLAARQQTPSRNWPARVEEVFSHLCQADPQLPEAVVRSPRFAAVAEHSLFATKLQGELAQQAARKLLAAADNADEETPFWTSELVRIVGQLPPEEAWDRLRAQWFDYGLRDAIALVLARQPQEADRARLFEALGSPQGEVVAAAAAALGQLEPSGDVAEIMHVLRQLKLACEQQGRQAERIALVQLLQKLTGVNLMVADAASTDPRQTYQGWFDWFAKEHAEAAAQYNQLTAQDGQDWQQRLEQIDFATGDVHRGLAVFQKKACHRCHQGGSRLGPDLAGAAGRFSREDLFAAIIEPSREVAPLYRTTMVTTRSGKTYLGMVVYESPDGTLLQISPDTTVRITGEELLLMQPSSQSLMPTGLLNDLTDQDLADLYAYLKSLTKAQ